MRKALQSLLPPGIVRLLKGLLGLFRSSIRLRGPFGSWKEAVASFSGYGSKAIFDKVLTSALDAQNQDGLSERDSVLIESNDRSWPLLAGLLWASSITGGTLRVLDFGGSLGSTYFQNREFFGDMPLRWIVVEQKHFVEAGHQHLQNEELVFVDGLGEGILKQELSVVLLSSVFQYLENPYEILRELLSLEPEVVIFDRTPFLAGKEDVLMVQDVPKSIYDASYPLWILSRQKFLRFMDKDFVAVASFPSPECRISLKNYKVEFEGFLFRRRRE